MNMSRGEYRRMVDALAPKSKTGKNCIGAFVVGGAICLLGQILLSVYESFDIGQETAATATSITLVLLSAVLSGLAVYDDIAKFAGAGTLIPITGFANAIVSPAVEYKTEGMILGTAAKMFTIAGPVIVYGVSASVVYGLIYWIINMI